MGLGETLWTYFVEYVLQPDIIITVTLVVSITIILTFLINWWNNRVRLSIRLTQRQFRAMTDYDGANTKIGIDAEVVNAGLYPTTILGVTIIPEYQKLEMCELINVIHESDKTFKEERLQGYDGKRILLYQSWNSGLPEHVKEMKATLIFRTSKGDKKKSIILKRDN